MQIGNLVMVDMGYANPYGIKKPFALAIIRDILFRYDPPRYHLTIISTGGDLWREEKDLHPVEEE